MKIAIAITCLLSVLLPAASTIAAGDSDSSSAPMAKFCAGCHQPVPGTMMGFLDTISTPAKTFQMDFGGHKEIITYSDQTVLKNVASFEDLQGFRHKGFRVDFNEVNGNKVATEIVRFDIAKTIADDEKLSRQDQGQAVSASMSSLTW